MGDGAANDFERFYASIGGKHREDAAAADAPAGDRPSKREEVAAVLRAVSTVRTGILFVCLGIWSVVGFLFWVPMLCYAIARFSALVAHTTIVGASPDRLAVHLEHAVRFYFQGFRNILRAIYGSPQTHTGLDRGASVDWGHLLLHTLGVVAFWSVVVGLAVLASRWLGE